MLNRLFSAPGNIPTGQLTMNAMKLVIGGGATLSALDPHSLFEAPGRLARDGVAASDGSNRRLAEAIEGAANRHRQSRKKAVQFFTDVLIGLSADYIQRQEIEDDGEALAELAIALEKLIDDRFGKNSWFERSARVGFMPMTDQSEHDVWLYFGDLCDLPAVDDTNTLTLRVGCGHPLEDVFIYRPIRGERRSVLVRRPLIAAGQRKCLVASSPALGPVVITSSGWQSKIMVNLDSGVASDVGGGTTTCETIGDRRRWSFAETGVVIEVQAAPAAPPVMVSGECDKAASVMPGGRIEPRLGVSQSASDIEKTLVPGGRKPHSQDEITIVAGRRRTPDPAPSFAYALDLIGIAMPKMELMALRNKNVRGYGLGLQSDGGVISPREKECVYGLGASIIDHHFYFLSKGEDTWRRVIRLQDHSPPIGWELRPSPLAEYHAFLMRSSGWLQQACAPDSGMRTLGRGNVVQVNRLAFDAAVPCSIDVGPDPEPLLPLDLMASRNHLNVALIHGQFHVRQNSGSTSAWKISSDLKRAEELGGEQKELVLANGDLLVFGPYIIRIVIK